jgi:hypothetical protein
MAGGCRGTLEGAVHSYDAGRYSEADIAFRGAERPSRSWDFENRARYALYRGLTHLALGDARAADRWLRAAKAAVESDPDGFSPEDRGRLAAAWRSLGHMPGDGR